MKRLSSTHITHRCSVGLLIHKVLRPVRFIIKNNALFLIFLYTDYKYIKYFLAIILPALLFLFCFVFNKTSSILNC